VSGLYSRPKSNVFGPTVGNIGLGTLRFWVSGVRLKKPWAFNFSIDPEKLAIFTFIYDRVLKLFKAFR